MMAALYLQVSIISQALIFVTRSRSWSFVERPGLLLLGAFLIAQLVRFNLLFSHQKCYMKLFPSYLSSVLLYALSQPKTLFLFSLQLLSFLSCPSAELLKYTYVGILKRFLIYFKHQNQCLSMYFKGSAQGQHKKNSIKNPNSSSICHVQTCLDH